MLSGSPSLVHDSLVSPKQISDKPTASFLKLRQKQSTSVSVKPRRLIWSLKNVQWERLKWRVISRRHGAVKVFLGQLECTHHFVHRVSHRRENQTRCWNLCFDDWLLHQGRQTALCRRPPRLPRVPGQRSRAPRRGSVLLKVKQKY